MRYSIEQYDKEGYLKAPGWLWLGWFFLAKAWVIFVMAGASRDTGAELLAIIYPVRSALYSGLVAGLPAIALIWLVGIRSPDRKWLDPLLSRGRAITLLTIITQFFLVLDQVYRDGIRFTWANGLTLLALLWLSIYILRSRRVRDCFYSPIL